MLCFKPGQQGFNASSVSVSLAFQAVSDCFALWAIALGRSSQDQLVVLLLSVLQPVRAATDQLTSEVLACLAQANFLLVVTRDTGIAVQLRKTHPHPQVRDRSRCTHEVLQEPP